MAHRDSKQDARDVSERRADHRAQPDSDRFKSVRDRLVNDLKQSCLDLAKEAGELFDRFEEHGLEAAWEGDGALVVMRMEAAHEHVRSFLAQQAERRMIALGVTPEHLARIALRCRAEGSHD